MRTKQNERGSRSKGYVQAIGVTDAIFGAAVIAGRRRSPGRDALGDAKARLRRRLHLGEADPGRELDELEPGRPHVEDREVGDDAVDDTPARERQRALAHDLGRAVLRDVL